MKRAVGFTLIEMAVAVFVIALLLGSILVPLTTQVEQRQISDTQKTLDEIRDALLGFAIANGYLPCPDTNNDGAEDFVAGTGLCTPLYSTNTIAAGNLPWQTLGVGRADVWGNRFRYVLREEYARRSPATQFSLSTTAANVRVCEDSTNCGGTSLTTTAVAAILAHGKNGYGAINSLTNVQNPLSASPDEQENYDTNRNIVSHTFRTGSPAVEFDDVVTWIPLYILFNRMVAAGKLP